MGHPQGRVGRNARLPDFVIIGAQKAASTRLLVSVRQHPQAWLPPKEVPFFRDPVYGDGDLETLADMFAGRTEARLGMKCPDYLARPEVPARLHRDLREPQLIVCLRNPIQRALAAYFWRMRWGMLSLVPAEEGMARILEGGYRDQDRTVEDVLSWGLYYRHLSRYLEYFPRDKILVLFDDDLRRDPEAVMRHTYRSLGIAADVMPAGLLVKQNPGIYSMARLRFGQRRAKYLSRWDATRTYHCLPYPANPVRRLYTDVIAGLDRYFLAFIHSNEKPTLSADLSARLWAYYADDVAALQVLLARDLTSWSPAAARQADNR